VPCPEALGVMLIAIGLERIALGLGLIVAFSLGLAAVLIAIGILLVRFRDGLDRLGKPGSRWRRLLPLVSAIIVTMLGVGIALKGLMSYVS
jgi:nickel/cobalt transporter (NicO) family protein